MRNIILISLLAFSVISCQKDIVKTDYENKDSSFGNVNKFDDLNKAKSEFSKILSKAIYNEPELRKFIKNTALEMFDNDYDVFYPYAKEQIVKNGQTFRQILLNYTDDDSTLYNIEKELPLLTIFVPDMIEFGGFNAHSWDLSDQEIAVTARNMEKKQVFYGDGEEMLTLDPDEIPGFPVLVVKTNEKLRVVQPAASGAKASAKASTTGLSYEFISKAFDRKSNVTQFDPALKNYRESTALEGRAAVKANLSTASSKIERDLLRIQSAWNEFGLNPLYWQRDNIYYGATRTPKSAPMNINIREYINTLEFDKSFVHIFMRHPDNPRYQEFELRRNGDQEHLSRDEVNRNLWTAGTLRIGIQMLLASRSSGRSENPDRHSLLIHPSEIYRFSQYKRTTWKPVFNRRRHVYSASLDDLVPQIYSPRNGEGLQLPMWNIVDRSMAMTFAISLENEDATATNTTMYRTMFVTTSNFNFTFGAGPEALRLGGSFGVSTAKTEEKTETATIVTSRGRIDLGNITFYFSDPIVTSRPWLTRWVVNGPQVISGVYSVSNGIVTMSLVPKSIF